MTRSLRGRHAVMWLLLGPVVIWLFYNGLINRYDFESPRNEVTEAEALLTQNAWNNGLSIETRVVRKQSELVLELKPDGPIKKPDVLVYWLEGGDLSQGYLLGKIGGIMKRPYRLPKASHGKKGDIVLYSLGHQEEVGRGQLDLGGLQ